MALLTVYHGGYQAVDKPKIKASKNTKDFGTGFYCTIIKEQAQRWARRYNTKIVSIYDVKIFSELKIMEFKEMTEEWLDFILKCRRKQDSSDYDIVMGGVANDKVFNTVELYFDHLIDKQEAIKRLRYEKPNMQICFRSERALKQLHFEGSFEV